MQIGEPGYFMVLVGPCVDYFIKFLKKVISVKMGHGTYHQGVLKKIIFTGPFKGCGKKNCTKGLKTLLSSLNISNFSMK